jgi:K+-sensing histidine kinase KdpD
VLIGVHVQTDDALTAERRARLEDQRRLVESLGGRFQETAGPDVPTGLLQIARAERVTQVVLGATRRSRWTNLVRGSIIDEVARAGVVDVHVVPQAQGTVPAAGATSVRRRPLAVSRRRRAAALLVAAAGLPLLTAVLVCTDWRDTPNLAATSLTGILWRTTCMTASYRCSATLRSSNAIHCLPLSPTAIDGQGNSGRSCQASTGTA